VRRGAVDAGGGGDLAQAHGVDAAFAEQALGRLQDAVRRAGPGSATGSASLAMVDARWIMGMPGFCFIQAIQSIA
jgi:hypothetical protein